MSENTYANALGQYNDMENNVRTSVSNFKADVVKKIDAQSDGIIGTTLGLIPAIEIGGKYLGKATGTNIEGGVGKIVRGVKSGIAKVKAKLKGNDTDDTTDEPPEAETPPQKPPIELKDMSSEGDASSSSTSYSKESETPKSENETPELDDALDNDNEIQPAPRTQTAEDLETKNPTEESDLGDESSNLAEKTTGDITENLTSDAIEDAGVEAGLNSLDAIPVIGELGMVAGAIYGLVHLFHHSKPSTPKTSQIATPTMDVEGDALNSVSMPIAHT